MAAGLALARAGDDDDGGWPWSSLRLSHEGAEGHPVGEHFLHEVLRLHRDARRVAGDDARHRRVLLEVLAVAGLLGGEVNKNIVDADCYGLLISSFISHPFQHLLWFRQRLIHS